MSEFSIREAALTGFRVVRAHPLSLLGWAPLSLVFSVGLSAVAGNQLPSVDPVALGQADLQALGARLAPMLPGLLLGLAVATVMNSLLYAAMNRAVLRPQEHRLAYLRLGPDELRQLALQLLSFLVLAAVYLASLIVAALFLGLGSLAGPIAETVFGFVAAGAGAAAMIFVSVRLSLAAPLSFVSQRVNLIGSWELTRGRFGPILLTYLTALGLALLVLALGAMVEYAVSHLLGAPDAPAQARTGAARLMDLTRPAELVGQLIDAFISALAWPVLLTPPAAIYAALGSPAGSPPRR